jgi:hypothetical protein
MSDWDFGGAFARTAGEFQRQDIEAREAPARLDHLQSLARLQRAQAGEAEQRAETERRSAAAIGQLSFGPDAKPSQHALKIAEAYAGAGNPVAAERILSHASAMQGHEEQAQTRQAQAKHLAAQDTLQRADLYGRLMEGVRSQADLDRANLIYASQTGEEIPEWGRTYDEGQMGIILGATRNHQRQLQIQMQKEEEARKAAADAERARHNKALETVAAARAATAAAKAGADKKDSGKDIPSPKKTEIDSARHLLQREGLWDGMDEAVRRSAADDLAAYARGLQRQNRNLDFGAALQRAYDEERQRGAYVTPQPKSVGRFNIPFTGGKGTISPRGAAPVEVGSLEELSKQKAGAIVKIKGKTYKYLGNGRVEEQ